MASNDIVTRLRVQRTNAVICGEAAHEIERLRKDRTDWMATAIHLANLGSKPCDTEDCWHCGRAHSAMNERMRQAIRRAARGR